MFLLKFSRRTWFLLLAAFFVLAGCASHIQAPRYSNQAPTEAYSKFARIEIKSITLAPSFAHDGANQKALAKIQENFTHKIQGSLRQWNGVSDNGRRLVIQPVITEIRFIGVGARIFAGPFAGSSGVRIELLVTDAATGAMVDRPEFYQHSSAGAGFALGVADNMMLVRAGELVAEYIINNYPRAVGGPTGAPHPEAK